ncbi:hypothetical protein C0989_011242 [Termitomyces sp. Mn162]|nr:hypothetical protein C0989_011242 [Termitomyces sp. Mn162]
MPKKSWTCAASGCDYKAQGNASFNCVLKHCLKCKFFISSNPELYCEALQASSDGSLGAQLMQLQSKNSTSKLEQHVGSPKLEGPKGKVQSNELNTDEFHSAGSKRKKEEMKQFKIKVDHIIMHLICVCGHVPHILDTPEWKELMTRLNSKYKPSSSNSFADDYIP